MKIGEYKKFVENLSSAADNLTISAQRQEVVFRETLKALLARESIEIPKK